MRKSVLFAVVASLAFAMPATAQQERTVEDGGTGPFKAVMTQDTSLSTHTVIRPADMSKFGKDNLIPVLLWGNGGCAKSCSGHVNFLSEVASQGFFIVAIGPMPAAGAGPQAGQTGGFPGGGMPQGGFGGFPGGGMPQGGFGGFPGGGMPQGGFGGFPGGGQGGPSVAPEAPQMGGGMSMGDPADMKIALEWVIAQNADKNSPYYGKLDIDNIGAAGMSCGGLEALHMSGDARIKTIMVMNSGYIGNGGADKESLNSMKTKSVIWILGGSTDIAYENGTDDFKQIRNQMPAFWSSLDGVGHGGTYMQNHGGDYAKVAGAWLKWQLKGDKEAGTMFTGAEPGISKMAGWSFDRKNIK
ncbi:MAG: alpha/beta hydrolase [Bacteroidaceae bacterium]|nr:alpha/beta hydrolase [Bacteroidaceae bacterium]